jgi:hypothetical protein
LDKADEWSNLGYSVACNEDEVIKFLLKNNISFKAVRHYGHESIFFKKDSDEILFIENTGLRFEMCENMDNRTIRDSIKDFKKFTGEKDVFRIVKVKDYLKGI